jgi:hypothetical protein
MPHEDSTLTLAKIKRPEYSLPVAGWIARLIVLDLVFIAAVASVLVVLLQTLWDYIHYAMIARAGTHTEPRVSSGHGLRR